MIGIVEINISAQNPNLPLKPVFAFKGSPSSFRIINVPPKIGEWEITNVFVNLEYPDNSVKSVECVKTKIDQKFGCFGGNYIWVATVEGCNSIGRTTSGFSIFANGTDENNNPVSDYCLGKGDLVIVDGTPFVQPGINCSQVKFFDSQPQNPNKGDTYQDSNGQFMLYNGTTWVSVGSNITKVSELENDAGYQNASQVQTLINNAGFLTSLNYSTNDVDYPTENLLENNTINHVVIPSAKDNQNRIWHHQFIPEANEEAEQDYSFLCENNTLYCCFDSMGQCWELYEWTYDDEQGIWSWYCIQTVEGSTSDTTIVFDEWQITLTIIHSHIGNLVFDDYETGKARDFLMYLESDVEEIQLYFPTVEIDDTPIVYLSNDDEVFSFDESGKYIMAFSEISPHTFLVNKQKLNVVTQSQGD